MKSAEISPSSLGIGVTADHEFLAPLAFEFDPVAGASADVAAVRFFGDNSFQPALRGGVKESFSRFHHVVAVVRLTEKRQEAFQALFAVHQRQRAQIMAVKCQAIEEEAFHGRRRHAKLNIASAGEMHACLQPLKARLSPLVKGDNLAIDDKMLDGQFFQRFPQFRVAVGDLRSVAPVKFDGVAVALGQNSHAVVFDFENPLRSGKGSLLQGCKHQRLTARREVFLGALSFCKCSRSSESFAGKVGHLFQGESGYHRLRIALDQLVGASEGIGLLQQQPIFLRLRHAREGPQSPHLVPEKFHFELAPFELFHRVAGFD